MFLQNFDLLFIIEIQEVLEEAMKDEDKHGDRRPQGESSNSSIPIA